MTALYGAIAWHGRSLCEADLAGVTATLHPYGATSMRSSSDSDGASAVMGVCDSPVPPSTPSCSSDSAGLLVVCADAFLHDRDRLTARLGWRGRPDASDADLIMEAYRRWGELFLDHLNGSFAIAILDRRRGGLLLARDPVGSRFLAYHRRDDLVAFASTALALTGFPGVGHNLDEERVAEVVALGYGTDRTFVRGVRSLLPGTAMWCDANGVRQWRWWLPDEPAITDLGSLDEHARLLRDQLERSVRCTLRNAEHPAVELSGGLDSSSVAAVAACLLGDRRLRSYTAVPPTNWAGPVEAGWVADERFAVTSLAQRHSNLHTQFIHVKGFPLFEHHESLWELGAGPSRNALNAIWGHSIHQEAAADGVDVLLNGGHGNFAFSADGPQWLAELARKGRMRRVAREAWSWAEARDKSLWRTVRGDLLWPLLPAAVRRRRAIRQGVDLVTEFIGATAIRADRLRELNLETALPRQTKPHPRGWTRDTSRMFNVSAAQAETAASMRALYGIEVRDPLADRVLLETALRQPEWWRRHAGVNRAACRAAMRDLLPTEIVDRTTLGAQLPDWLDRLTDRRSEVAEELQQLRDHPPSRNVIDVEKLDRLMQAWPDLSQAADPKVIADYQSGFSRALLVSKYARWFESRARRVAAGGPAVVVSQP